MYLGSLWYGGVEVINDARVADYADAFCLPAVDLDDAWAGLAAYGDHPADGPLPAPWYDPADPATGSFLGLVGVSIDTGSSPATAAVADAVTGDGGTPGPSIAGPREMLCKAVAYAADSAGLRAGLAWLDAALTGRAPTREDPAAEQAALTSGVLPPRWGAPPRPGGLEAPLQLYAEDTPTDLHTLFDVKLTDGPDVTATHLLAATPYAPAPRLVELQWTFTAGQPWLWAPPVPLGYTGLARWPHAYGTGSSPWAPATGLPVRWVMQRDLTGPLAARGADPLGPPCGGGSGCPPVQYLPRGAALPHPCAATQPLVPTYGHLADLADAALPGRATHVPIVVIDPGAGEMRRASVRIGRRLPGGHHDPTGRLLRWEMNVPYLPAGSRCVLDGRTRTAVTYCTATGDTLATVEAAVYGGGPVARYTPAAYGLGAGPLVWPTFPGAEDLRFTAHTEDNHAGGAGARVTLYAAQRQALV